MLLIIVYTIFHAPRFSIQQIIIQEENSRLQDSSSIKKELQIALYKKNYLQTKLSRSSSIKKIEKTYPLIKKIIIDDFEQGKVQAKVEYHNPLLIIQVRDKSYTTASYNNKVFIAKEWYKRTTTGDNKIYHLSLPAYIQDSNLTGIFHDISEITLYNVLKKIETTITIQDIIYHIGGWKLRIKDKTGKIIFLDLKPSIEDQITKYNTIKKHFKDFDKIQEIDLGSAPQPIIKIKEKTNIN